ncbi:YciI family protein [Acuticoccus sp. M5D2P5]|uniref:YciI family protein n=1 Tax=Acuticoccus kalidii TaxID=2910977 RepID=UPI001F177984|nr:YciI family protein [Acuticoccus kalidii]MCF3933114.1 YciI family protein [Acuticoccus kalidii]
MLFAIMCYHDEATVMTWTKAEDDAVLAKLDVVHGELLAEGRLGPVVRLLPTQTARTVRSGEVDPMVHDGPFAETKEQLLGFYVIDCETQEAAQDIAKALSAANPGGAYEIRPMQIFKPGALTP